MKRVLLYVDNEILVYDISTPELEAKAWLALFDEFNIMEFYSNVDDPRQKELYEAASNGNAEAAKDLLRIRRNYESENFYIRTVSE